MEGLRPNIGSEKKGLAKEITSSPEVFIDEFLNSSLFLNGRHKDVRGLPDLRGYNDFLKELETRGVEGGNDEKRRVFLGMNEAKLLLLHFAK